MGGLRQAILATLLAAVSAAAPAWAADPCAGYTPQPKPQNTSHQDVGQDLDAIVDRGYVTFAVYADNAPYSWMDKGKPRGVDVDVARLIADELGVEARFNFVPAGENLQADLMNNVWRGPVVGGAVSNVMMRVPYNPAFACRVDQVVFTGLYADEEIGIAFRRADYPDGGPTVPYFRYDSVGVENDSISDFYLTSFANGQLAPQVHRFGSTAEAMSALDRGEVKAVMGPLAQLQFGEAEGEGIHEPPLPNFSLSHWTLGVAIHTSHRPLAYAVDDAVAAGLDDGRIAAIYTDYGLTLLPPRR